MTQQQEGQPGFPGPGPVPTTVAPEPTPPPAPAPAATTPQLPLGITTDDVTGALRIVSRSLLPVLGGLTVLVAVLALAFAPEGHGGSLADWLRSAVMLLALALGGRAVADGSLGAGDLSAEMDLGLRLLPLVLTVLVLALVARAGAAAERSAPSTGRQQLLVRSALTGLVAGVGLAIVAALGRSSSFYAVDLADEFDSAGVNVGAGVLGAFVGATLLVSLVSAGARLATSTTISVPLPGSFTTPERAADLRAALATLRTFLVGLLAAAAIGVVLAFLHRAFLTDDLDGDRWDALAGLLVLCVNAVVVVALGALGVPMVANGEASGNADLLDLIDDSVGNAGGVTFTLFDDKVWLLALLVPLAVALGTAVRRSLRRPGVPVTASGLKAAAACGAVAGFVAALLVRVSVSGSVSGSSDFIDVSGSASLQGGPSLLWAPILGAAWAVLAVWLLRTGPTLALSLPPRVTRRIAGRRIAPEWAAALDGAAPAPAGTRSAAVRTGALVVAVLLALGAVGSVVVAAVNSWVLSPQATAESYLDAVADRDVPGVLDHLSDAPEIERQLFLSDRVFDSDDFVPISDVSVGEVQEYGSSASVRVTYAVGDEEFEDSIDLVQGEDSFGLFRNWEVAEALPTVEVYSDSDLGAQIAGAELTDDSYLALPGGYRVSAAEHALLTSDPSMFVVTTNQSNGPSMDPEVKPEALDSAREAVEERLANCVESEALPLDNCPFLTSWDEYWDGEISAVAVTVTAEPEFSLTYDEYLGGLMIVTEEYGEARLTGTTVGGFFRDDEPTPYEDEFTFSVSGVVTGSADDLEVEFDD
jgi:hypothetical protein